MNHLEEALDEVDACVFTGDSLHNEESRNLIKEHLERWLKAVNQYEGSIPKCPECNCHINSDTKSCCNVDCSEFCPF